LEKVKNFDWDEWRKRFLKFNNNKKSRVTDLLRKLDEDGDGYLNRFEIIILKCLNLLPACNLKKLSFRFSCLKIRSTFEQLCCNYVGFLF
jgi:hypothetical protein